METFSELLSRYIKRTGISDAELARAIGISRQTVFRWREGLTSRPNSREDVLAIVKKLRLSTDEKNSLLMSAGFRPEEPAAPQATNAESEPPLTVLETPTPDRPAPAAAGKPKLKRTRLIGIVSLVVLVCLAGIFLAIKYWPEWFPPSANNTYSRNPIDTQTAPAVIAGPGELLVLVAPLSRTSSGISLTGQLADALNREAAGNRVSSFRAIVISDMVTNTSETDSLLMDYKAKLIVYGTNKNDSISITFVPPPVQPFSPIILDEADITGEQVKALSLLVLASVSLNQGNRERASIFLSAAHALIQDSGIGDDPCLPLFNLLSEQASQ
jgi:transcriptional regulator with XRE-family HTH domain